MSDQQKGLNLAIARLLPHATEAYCCKHIERNIESKYKIDISVKFWAVVKAYKRTQFEKKMEELREDSQDHNVVEHLRKISYEYWADFAFPTNRHGQRTSNLVEQQNNVYRQAPEKPILDMLQQIWDDAMEKRCRRNEAATAAVGALSTAATAMKQKDQDDSRTFRAHRLSLTVTRVFSSHDWRSEFIVTLLSKSHGSWTCGVFQNDMRPCKHAWAFLDDLRSDRIPYFAPFYTRAAWIAAYQLPIPSVPLVDLIPDASILPPKVKVQIGRLETERRGSRYSTANPARRFTGEGICVGQSARLQRSHASQAPPVAPRANSRGTGVCGRQWEYILEATGPSVASSGLIGVTRRGTPLSRAQ